MGYATTVEIFSNLSYPLDNSHVRYFATLSAQNTFFSNLPNATSPFNNQTYQRVGDYDLTFRVSGNMTQAQKWGYARFKNRDEANKWYYTFINQVEYIDDDTIKLHCSIDFFQTYVYDMTILQSMVERQHERLYQSNGLPIVNTVNENLDYGTEYDIVFNDSENFTQFYLLHVISTKEIGSGGTGIPINIIGIPTPVFVYCIPYLLGDDSGIKLKMLDGSIEYAPPLQLLFDSLKSDADIVNSVISCYWSVYNGIDFQRAYDISTKTLDINKIGGSQAITAIGSKITISDTDWGLVRITKVLNFQTKTLPTVFEKYKGVPSYNESKLLMSPYTIVELVDMKGGSVTLKPEYIDGKTFRLLARSGVSTQNKIAYMCDSYLTNVNNRQDISVYLNALIDDSPNNIPILTDASADYIQGNINQVNTQRANAKKDMSVGIINSAVNAVPMFAMGMGGLGGAGLASGIIENVNRNYNVQKELDAKMSDIKNIPPSVSAMGGDSAYEMGNSFTFPRVIVKTIKPEYQEKLSNFFKVYGYQVNRLTIPNLNTRLNWNYVKVTSLNVKSGYNRDIVMRFKEIFEKGVTLWHNDDIMNYDKSNGVR